MNRRGFLAVAGTAGATMVAGCGFAHDAGALRDESSIHSPSPEALFDQVDDRFVIGRSTSRFVRDEDGEMNFESVTIVPIYTQAGHTAGRADVRGSSSELAADGDDVYALQEEQIVAARPDPELGETAVPEPAGTEVRWTATVPGAGGPMAAADGAVYVRQEDALARVADGHVDWELTLDGPPQAIHPDADGPVVITTDAVYALGTDGEERWSLPTTGTAHLDRLAGTLAIRDDETLCLIDREDGSEAWEASIQRGGDAPRIGRDHVAVPTGRGIEMFDRSSGDRQWHVGRGHRPNPVLAVDAGTVYAATGNGSVLAIADGETRWRSPERVGGDPLAAWVEEDRVAFCYDTGAIRRFQRRDESMPLLF